MVRSHLQRCGRISHVGRHDRTVYTYTVCVTAFLSNNNRYFFIIQWHAKEKQFRTSPSTVEKINIQQVLNVFPMQPLTFERSLSWFYWIYLRRNSYKLALIIGLLIAPRYIWSKAAPQYLYYRDLSHIMSRLGSGTRLSWSYS